MTTDLTETALADHLRRRSNRLSAPPEGDTLDRIVARSTQLGRRRRGRRLTAGSVATVAAAALVATLVVLPDEGTDVRTGTTDATGSAGATTTMRSAPDDPAGGEPGIVAPPLPFDQFQRSADGYEATNRATDAMITACMAERGLGDRPIPGSTLPDSDASWPDAMIGQLYGVFDQAEVRQRGYAPPQWSVELERRRQEASDAPTFTEQYGADVLAAWSVCQFQAGEHLRGGPQDMASPDHPANLLGELRADAQEAAEADGRIADVVAAWSTCMAGRGYAYAHPTDPARDFPPDERVNAAGEPLPPSDTELTTGLDDVACKAEVGFATVWYSVLAEYEQQAIDEHPDEVEAARQWDEAFVARARAVLADG